MLYIASDHAGFEQKESIKRYLHEKNIDFQDMGPDKFDPQDDYPDFAYPAIARMDPDKDKAILFCGSGQGMAILANKLKGIRATVIWNTVVAKAAREDDDANVLTIASRETSLDEVKKIVDTWLKTPFSGADRHVRRLKKIEDLENKLFPGSKSYE